MDVFVGLPSIKTDEPFDYSILESEMEFHPHEGIVKIADFIYIFEKNCNGIFGADQKKKEWDKFLFRLTYYAYLEMGKVCNFENYDYAIGMFEYIWKIAVMKHSHEQQMVKESSNEKTKTVGLMSSTGVFDSLKSALQPSSIVDSVLPVGITGMLLYIAPKMPSVAWIGFGLCSSFYVSKNIWKNNGQMKQPRIADEKETSPEEVGNGYIKLISCSICYKNADPTTYKAEMKQFGCRHAICTSCSLEQIRHHWNDRSEHRPPIRCPMCCKPSRTEPLAIHYI